MRRLVAAILLCSSTAAAQTPSPSVAYVPGTTFGALIEDDALTVSHVVWNGSALVDTKGNSWTQNGTVPQVAAGAPLFPSGYGAAGRAGAGPFSGANYYGLAAAGALALAGDFTVCVIGKTATSVGSNLGLFMVGDTGNARGFQLFTTDNAYTSRLTLRGATTPGSATANARIGTPNVFCGGKAGSTAFARVLGGAAVTGSAVGYVPALSTDPASVGNRTDSSLPYTGTIYEAWLTSTPYSDANVTTIFNRVAQQLGGLNENLTVTRTTAESYSVNPGGAPPTLFYVPNNVVPITASGIQISPAATNLALQSEDLTTSWTATNVTVTANTRPFADGNTTMETLASTLNTGQVKATTPIAVTSSTGPFTVSGWLASTTGSAVVGTIGMIFGTGNATGCTCVRDDGGACTTATATITGYAYLTTPATTNPVRLALTCSTTLAAVAVTPFATGGQYLTSTGTVAAGGMQFETGAWPTPYIPTTTVAVTRNVDLVSIPNPLAQVSGTPGPFCVDLTLTYQAGNAAALAAINRAVSAGTIGAANSWRVSVGSGSFFFTVIDSGGTARTWSSALSSGAHRLTGCYVSGTVPGTLWIDGAAVSGGAAVGLLSQQPTTIYIGSASDSSGPVGASIQNLKICAPALGPADCNKEPAP